MRLGMITAYKIGFNKYGIEVKNIFSESVRYNYTTKIYRYFQTRYYVKINNRMWFLEEYQMKILVEEREKNCIQTKLIVHEIIRKHFAL